MNAFTFLNIEGDLDEDAETVDLLKRAGRIELDSTILGISIVAQKLEVPWEMVWGPDGWIWFTERPGRINRLHPETGQITELLRLRDCYNDGASAGLHGLALHPDFSRTPYVYIIYNYSLDTDSNDYTVALRCVRYTYDSLDDRLTEPVVYLDSISVRNPVQAGKLCITSDRKLLLTTADGSSKATSQDVSALAGKMLRINLDGSVPEDNPFPGSYVYTVGHRCPQGLVEAPNGAYYSSEHGPLKDDEINIIIKGGNYGWPDVSGYCDGPEEIKYCNEHEVVEPIYAWTPTLATSSIEFYNDTTIPEWNNCLLVTTLKEQDFRVLRLNVRGDSVISEEVLLDGVFGRLRDFCIAPDGSVLISTSNQTEDMVRNPPGRHDLIIRLSPISDSPE